MDLTEPTSFDSAAMWKQDIVNNMSSGTTETSGAATAGRRGYLQGKQPPPVLLVGSKHDQVWGNDYMLGSPQEMFL